MAKKRTFLNGVDKVRTGSLLMPANWLIRVRELDE
jgi:hypothetical protein